MRRHRKARVVWLTNIGTIRSSAAVPADQYGGQFFQNTLALGGNNNPTVSFGLVHDKPPTEGVAGSFTAYQNADLSETQSLGYRLRRIVGKLHIAVKGDAGFQPPSISPALIVTAGLMIRRVDENGDAVMPGTGVTTQSCQNVGDPWIWRRCWVLSTGIVSASGNNRVWQGYPTNNTVFQGSGTFDGAHVDQKTARRIGPEERLFLDVSFLTISQLNGIDEVVGTYLVGIHFDYRVLATLITNAGNRRNATR